MIKADDVLVSTNGAWPARARITSDARIVMDDEFYETPSGAACAVKNGPANGWDFWARQTPTGSGPLSTLRTELLEQSTRPRSKTLLLPEFLISRSGYPQPRAAWCCPGYCPVMSMVWIHLGEEVEDGSPDLRVRQGHLGRLGRHTA